MIAVLTANKGLDVIFEFASTNQQSMVVAGDLAKIFNAAGWVPHSIAAFTTFAMNSSLLPEFTILLKNKNDYSNEIQVIKKAFHVIGIEIKIAVYKELDNEFLTLFVNQ